MEDKKSYYVQIPGTQQGQTWDEDKYNRNADKLREKYPDAVVMETSPYTDGDFADDDLFRVQIPGTAQGQTWDGAKFRRNREALMSKYPDVSISRFSPISGAVQSELNFNDEPQGQPKNVQMPVRGYWDEKGSEQVLNDMAPVKTPQEIAQQQEAKIEPAEQQLYPNAGAVSKFDLSRATMPMRQQMDTPWMKSSINQPTSQQEWNDSFEAWKLQQEEGALTAEEKQARLDAIRGKQYDNMPDGERLLAKVKDRRMSDRMRDIIYEGEIASRKEDAEKHALPGFWQGWANARARGLAGLNQLSGELGKAILGDEDYTPKQDALGYLASYIEGTKGEGNAEDLLRNLSKTIKDENGADVSVPFYTIDEKNLKGDEYTKKARKEYERNKNWYEALTEAIKANGGDLEKTFDALNKDVGGKMSRIQQITREAAADIASLPETNGFGAWLGGMMPMVGTTAAGMVASAVTKSPVPAQILGRLSMGLMSADMAGEAMNVARQYGASDAEVFESGLSSAAIMYLMGKIPFNKFTSRVLSVSSNSAAKKMAAAMSDPSTPLGKEAQMLWNNFRKTYGTEKLFSQSNFAQWIADAVSTGSNFATMGALETIVPMIYENPEDYPTFNEILENAKQGFIDGLAFGGATGAASIYARHSANIDRWRKQGGMMYAAMDDGSVAEVLAVNNHPVKFRNPKTYQNPAGEGIQRVVNEGGYAKIDTTRGSEAELYTEGALSPHSFGNEATVTILHNGEVKEVPASRLRSIGMKYTEDVIDEYNKVLRDATADEQSGVSPLELEAGVKEAEDAAREQNLLPPGPDGYTSKELADGTMTDAQIDAAMDYNIAKGMQDNLQQQKRDAIREDILGRTGKPFWNTEHPEGADKDTETVSSIRYDDGREVFLKKGDKDGNYVTLNEDGEAGFITRDQIDALLATGEVTEFNDKLPLDTYLDKRAAEQDAIEEQERLQQEYAQNLTALVEKFQNEKSINIGSPEQEIQAPILAVDGTPEGGVIVQAEEGEKLIPWAEIAAKYDMPYMPQTNEEKVQTLVDANKEEAKAEEAAGEEESVAPTEEVSEPQNIYDDEVANELGIPAEFLKVTKKGRNVVNTNLLWEKNPALLAQYNDKTNVLGMNTVEYLTEKVDQVDKEISKQEALLKKEVLGANDEDRKEDIKDKITELTERRKEIAGVLQPYVDAMKAAEEAAAAEKAALEQEKAEAKAEKAANEDPALREPMTLEEAVANFISGLKKGSLNKEDFMRELGWSDEEAKRFFPYWAGKGKGMTLLKLAEQIGHEDTTGFVPQHGEADQADTQAIRDAVIDVLQSSVSPKDVTDYTKRRNLDRRMQMDEYAKGLEEFEAQQAEAAEAVANPVQQEIAAAREEVNTEPTEAQKEAGNYKKGHIQLDGYDISIENPKGSIRKGTDASGKEWQQVMNNDYGYIRMTEGVDGDHIDVFLSDNPTEGNVFVVDQRNPQTGEFDEHKVMYGFNSAEEARAAYLANYEEGWQGLGAITEVTKDEFRKWIDSSHRKTKPFSEYKSVKAEGAQNEAPAAPVVEDMPEDLFSLLGTTREQAVMDSIQDKMDAIHKGLAEVKDDAEREAIIKEKQQLLKNLYDSLGMDAQVETRSTIVEAYKEGGRSERNIQQLEHALEYSKEEGENMRGFYDGRTTIFINTDDIVSVRSALTARGHEDQHRFNKLTGALAGVEAVAPPISEIYAAVRKLSGSNYYAGDNVVAAADELVANAREIADVYGEDAIARELQKAGINNEEFINFVANIVHNGREASKRNSDSRRHASEYAAQAVDNRQNERDSQAESPAVGGRGAGSLQRGSQAAQGEQELSDGGRIGNLPEQNGRASGAGAAEANQRANHAGAVRRAGEDLKPAERARLEDLDRDGTGKPDIIDNLNDATEGTSLFSLDKKNRSLVGLHNISAEKLRKAILLGGLANPSCAVIDLNYQNHFEYGDITFLLPSDLVGKRTGRNAGTWVRDAWTPTFPKITFHETKESQKNLKELLKDLPKDLRFLIDRKIYDFINENTYHSGLEYIFLKEKGMEPEIQVNPRKYPNASEKEFFEKYLKQPEMSQSKTSGSDIMDAYEALSPEDRKMANMYVLHDGDMSKIEHALKMEEKWPHLKEVHEEPLSFAALDSFLYEIMRDECDAGQENIGLTIQKAIDDIAASNELSTEFSAWQDKTINDLGYEAKIFIGYTDNGRKYKKATLENVSKEMKKEGSNGAQQNSGLSFGSILASMAKKMNSLSEIRANRNRLVSKDEYQQKREELMDKAKEFFFTFYDNNIAKRDGLYTAELVAADYVRDFFIKGHSIDKVVEDFNREQKKSLTLTDEEKAAFNAFRKELQDAPTDIFETKFERPVYVNEFAAVVIPDDTPLDVRQALEQIGLKLYEYKGDERSDERAAAVRKAAEENDGVLFSFIGKRGAEAMDIEDKTRERRDNLAVARQMEKDKATPGAIKWATGWERGADGMWRYEIPDFTKLDLFGDVMYDKRNPDHVRYKELLRKTNAAALMPESHEPLTTEEMDEYNKLYRKYNGGVKRDMLEYGMLEDFIDADDLFKAYPQLRHYTLRFEDLPDRVGGYAEKRGVVLNMKNRFQYEKVSDDLLHEIQHEIQDIEGFSLGTSLDAAERKARVLNSQPKDALTGREWDFVDLVRLWVIRDAASKAANPLDHWLAEWHKDGLYSDELYKEMIEGKSADELKRLYNQLLIKSKKKQVLSSWDVYKRTAGEVEARNASRRRRFTLEERRASAAENTEDVSRADQILNMPASSLLDWTDDEDFSIAMQSQKQPGKTYIKADEDDIAFSLAYHGSGADYDRFDISHALEGEGAMAHGYGHYVALNKDVAKGYAYAADGARRGREIRSAVQLQLDKAPSYYAKELLLATVQEMESGVPFEESKAKTLNMLKKSEEKRKAGRVDDYWKNTSNAKEIEFFEGLNNLDIPQWNHSRNLYTVDIPEDTGDNYLYEDKRVGQRILSRVAKELDEQGITFIQPIPKIVGDDTKSKLNWAIRHMGYSNKANGKDLYEVLESVFAGDSRKASNLLSDAGFVGIKYNGGVDGPCAVIFNDGDIGIEDHVMFSLGKNNRSTIEKWLDKREDLSKAQKAAFVGWLDGLSNPTLQLATARWFTQGAIRLPEDMPKVEQAVSVAGKAKVDPLQYDSPMALLEAHADFKPTEKRINPDEVSTLHKAKDFKEHGITVYDVDDSEESRQNMRQIINTHFGKEASPWCLLQGDGNGNLTEQSAQSWKHYNGYPKQVAFKDGKLLAFSANDDKRVRLWWDRQDSPHYDIPAGWRLIKGDALGREVQYVYSENGMLKPEDNSFMKKGNRENGEYTEWYPNGNLSEHGFYKNGKEDGLYETYNERQGYLYSRINYKEGVQEGLSEYFHPNGTLRSRTNWKDGKIDGTHELFHDDGSLSYIRHYKGGSYDGLAASYNRDGTPIETLEFKNGREHGKHEMYFSDGKQVKLVEYYDDGKLHGAKIKYDYDGYPRSIENYVHGARQGVQEYYDYGHGKLALKTTEKDNIVRKSEGFNSDGTISFVKRYNEYGEPDGVWKFWTRDGKLDRMLQFENGVEIRDLLADGVTEQEADVDTPSFSFVSKEEQERLDKEPTVTMYRAMALVDGKLYPPMSSKEPNGPGEKGKRLQMRPASELGRWERADEAPEKAKEGKDGKYYFDLKKSNGESVDGVLYNPYFHTSASPLNDQFTGASQRPELVTVEVEVPISELAGKYKAEKAADAVGAKDWHSGTVTAQMGSGRQVVLSRWVKPVRIVPDAEVAAIVAPKLKEKGIAVPANVVTPSLLAELQKQGVRTDADNLPMFSLVKEGNIDDISREFDSQLDLFKQNKQRGLFNLGRPSGILRSAGITVNQLSLSPVVLRKHIDKHGFTTDDIKGLVYALQKPIMVYTHGKTHPNFIVITNMDYHNGQRITVSIEIAEDGSIGELNNISSIHTKSADFDINRLGEFSEEELKSMLRWVDKEKVSAWYNAGAPEGSSHIDEQKLSSVTKVINDFENPKDADYFFAIYSGDMKKAQQMVDEAAREAFPESAVGKAVLHGTKNQFRAFDPNKIGSNTDAGWLGRGFYFYGNNPTYASQYANFDNPKGGYIIRAYLNIQNPYWASVEDFRRLAEANDPKMSEEFTQRLKDEGYDGVYYNGDGNEEWVAFYPNQIKSAEPVTYDKEGNVIPLSERFNPNTDDINFSLTSRQEALASVDEKGLAGIMDVDEVREFRKGIYNVVPQSIREQIVDEALGNGMNIGKALDSYLQRLAEGGTQNDETGLLRELYNQIRDITGDEALTDEDCRYIIWNEGHGPVADDDIFGLISQMAHKKRFGAGEEAPMFSARSEFGEATDEAREVAKEKVDEAKAELDETKKEAKQEAKQGALKAITLAMRGQKYYDKKTVDAVVKYAKEILRNGRIASLSRTEVNRLLGLVSTSAGKAPAYVKRYVDQLTDTMLDILVRDEADAFKELMNTKDTKIDSHGVEVMGKVDLLGQEMLKALRDYYNRPIEEIQARLSEISDKLSIKDDAIRKRAWAEKDGLELAEQYQRMIADNKAEEKRLKNELADFKDSDEYKALGAKARAEYVADTNDAIREGKLDRVDSYRQLSEVLKRLIKKSAEGRADFDDAEAKRVSDIQYDANRDMAGEDSSVFNKESRLGRLVNNRIVRFFARPLATFDQMMRLFARHSITGEGYLYNRYMRGWLRAREKYIDAISEAYAQMDAKASEVFGKKMKWTDLYKIDKHLPTMTVRMWDGEKMADIELRQGNLLYIYMANKMLDGKMKLRRMGISEDKVKAIRDNLDPRFVELADWLQGEHLPSLRNKYNAIHEQLFGAPMAAIEDYFPLKIAKGDIPEAVDVSKDTPDSPLSSTVTGHIIKRTKNSRMLDIANANAFDIAVEHLESMEEWAAFARFRKDLNILLSYKHFRNQVKNMNTIYGSGDKLWQNFVDVSKIVAGTYRPEGKGTSLVNLSKGFTSGKINFRLHTALKQTLSYPAFWADARIDDLYHAVASPIDSWNWCMENLPVFKRRWEKRTVGDTRLMKTDSDWKVWQKNFVKAASRYGMVPNAFVDAWTISIGTKAVYDSKLRKYLAEGMSQEEADRRAKQDATIIYNQSQQSDENAFVSALQLDRTFEAAGLSTFRNASMGYQRRVHNAYRTLGRLLSGKKESYIAGMTKQYISEGLSPEQAKARAEQEYSRAGVKAAGEIFIYQFFLNFLWKLGPLGALYLIAGGDNDKKKKKLKDAALTTAITGFFEGLSMGGSLTDLTGGWVSGEGVRNWNFLSLPVLQDVQRLWETIDSHGFDTKSVFEIVSLLSQGFCGVDPHILSDTFNAVGDAANWDMGLMKEISLLLMRIGQSPQSQMKDFYIDEIKETRKKAGKQSAKELAERYVEYQRKRKDPIGTVIGSDDKETEKKDEAATTRLMNEAFPKKQK